MPHRPGPNQTQATITVQRLPPGAMPSAPAFYGDGNYEYKEGFIVPEPLVDGKIETLKERARVTNQVYRSSQLIYPGPKATHDCVLGSYLRHVREPYFSTIQVPYGNDMHSRVTNTVQQRAAFPNQTPDGRRIVHQNYNNPGGLYSSQNAQDAFALHTGMRPGSANPASKLSDITMSPTYQFLHANDSVQQHSPTSGQVYSPAPSQSGQSPWGASVSPRGGPTQSTSFNTIMHTVCPPGSQL